MSKLKALVALAGLLLGLNALPASGSAPFADIPTPTLSAPPAGIHGHPMWDSFYDLKPFGYTQQELFVSGTATDATGKKAAYTTRFVVFRPTSAKRFNGTVMLDWTNVTAQFENAVDTMEAREMLMREGFAFVHLSAQKAGLCCTPLTPQVWDPVRYASINHPGDAFAFSMLDQVAKAFRAPKGINPLGSLKLKHLLAVGQSQSASELYDYVSQDTHHVIDGFLIHGGGEKTFTKPLQGKVIHLLSDREAATASPTKDPSYRLWEVAGTAHSDYFIGWQSVFGLSGRLVDQPAQSASAYAATMTAAGNYGIDPTPFYATCILAGSTMPMHYATSSAIYQLNRWVSGGKPAISTPRFAFTGSTEATDADGNSLGGLRLPPIQVPVATYKSTACPLGGITVPMTDDQLRQRYPTFAGYWAKMRAATDTSVTRGWVLPQDGVDMMSKVCAAKGRWAGASTCPTYKAPAYDR